MYYIIIIVAHDVSNQSAGITFGCHLIRYSGRIPSSTSYYNVRYFNILII